MNYLSVCSGIEAATVAWHPLGWHPVAFSEIEPFPCAVLKHHYPDVPNLGDMTKYKEWNVEQPVDLVVGGTPCQSFSVAGLRKGLDDPRGNLALVFLGLVDHVRPRWVVWENVPGVLSSSGGRDFGAFLGALEELGYGFAYRVLDAQYFGVAQRRRRVFVVGHLGDWRPAAAVLFESHSLSGHPAPRRKAGERTAPTIAQSPKICGGPGFSNQELFSQNGYGLITSYDHAVAYGIRTAQTSANGCGIAEEVAHTMDQANAQVVAFAQNTRDEVRAIGGNIAGALPAQPGMKQQTYIAYGGGNTAGEIHVATACNCKGPTRLDFDTETFVVKSFDGQSGGDSRGIDPKDTAMLQRNQTPAVQVQWASGGGQIENDTAQAIRSGAEHSYQFIRLCSQVRRLTPVECERLQGFPDNYTNIPWRNKPNAPDGPRYKALGNSMAVPVMRWIGQRIQLVEDTE